MTNEVKTIANAQGAEVSTIMKEDDMVQKEVSAVSSNNEDITDDEWLKELLMGVEDTDCSDSEGNDWEWSDDEDYDPEWSYGEKCSLIDEFFEKKGLTYLRGDAPFKWFEYHFNDNTFTMDGSCYKIEIQPDGWFNVVSKKGRGIGEFDIRFMSELTDLKGDLIDFLNDNYMLNN